jgi:hypothetical protein
LREWLDSAMHVIFEFILLQIYLYSPFISDEVDKPILYFHQKPSSANDGS